MKTPIVVIGIGNLGKTFAQAFLRMGHPVYPVLRDMDPGEVAREVPEPALVLVAVREEHLHGILSSLPATWRDRVALVQNELLPRDWQAHDLPEPTVAVVWFERRKHLPPTPYYPNPVYGPHADILLEAMDEIEMETVHVTDPDDLLFEMVRKNLYIVAKNIVGLAAEGTVGEVWAEHRELFEQVAGEVLDVQEWLAGEALPRERLMAQLDHDITQLPDKSTKGSSAPIRLRRMIAHADEAGLAVPRLREIAATL